MSNLREIEIETIIYLIGVVIATILCVLYLNRNFIMQFRLGNQVVEEASDRDIALEPVKDPALEIETSSQISPDGTNKLNMKLVHSLDDSLAYLFTTSDATGSGEEVLYGFVSTASARIPFNTWSPNNKYIFIEKDDHALVFRQSGEPFTNGEKYLDATNIFGEKISENTFDKATGWASSTLLIINSITPDGDRGPSYWFEVPSQAIYRLSTQF